MIRLLWMAAAFEAIMVAVAVAAVTLLWLEHRAERRHR